MKKEEEVTNKVLKLDAGIQNMSLDDDNEDNDDENYIDIDDVNDEDYVYNEDEEDDNGIPRKYNTLSFPKYSKACDRGFISNPLAAFLGNALLDDVGFISKDNPTNMLDPEKMRRERLKHGLKQIEKNWGKLSGQRGVGLYFDGKKCKTLVGKVRRVKVFHIFIELSTNLRKVSHL